MTDAPAFPGLRYNAATTAFMVSDNYEFKGHEYELGSVNGATKADVLTGIAAAVGGNRYPASGSFLKGSQLRDAGFDESVGRPEDIRDKGTQKANARRNLYLQGVDPFLLKAIGAFAGGNVSLYYQFGVASYGYVVKIEQENQTYTMHPERGQNALTDQPGDANKFESGHDTSTPDDVIADVAELSTTQPGPVKEKRRRLDAVTKLAGEGARWQCVKAHGARLRDTSRFYTQHPKDPGAKAYLEFRKLWGMWKDYFDNQYNIPNQKVADVIVANVGNANLVKTMTPQEAASDAHFDLGPPS